MDVLQLVFYFVFLSTLQFVDVAFGRAICCPNSNCECIKSLDLSLPVNDEEDNFLLLPASIEEFLKSIPWKEILENIPALPFPALKKDQSTPYIDTFFARDTMKGKDAIKALNIPVTSLKHLFQGSGVESIFDAANLDDDVKVSYSIKKYRIINPNSNMDINSFGDELANLDIGNNIDISTEDKAMSDTTNERELVHDIPSEEGIRYEANGVAGDTSGSVYDSITYENIGLIDKVDHSYKIPNDPTLIGVVESVHDSVSGGNGVSKDIVQNIDTNIEIEKLHNINDYAVNVNSDSSNHGHDIVQNFAANSGKEETYHMLGNEVKSTYSLGDGDYADLINNFDLSAVENLRIEKVFDPTFINKIEPVYVSDVNDNSPSSIKVDRPLDPSFDIGKALDPVLNNKTVLLNDFSSDTNVDNNLGKSLVPNFGIEEVPDPILENKAASVNDFSSDTNADNIGQSLVPSFATEEILNPILKNKAESVNDLSNDTNAGNIIGKFLVPNFGIVKVPDPILENKAESVNDLSNANNNIGQPLVPNIEIKDIPDPMFENKANLANVSPGKNNIGLAFDPNLEIGQTFKPIVGKKGESLLPKFETGEVSNPTSGNKDGVTKEIIGSNNVIGQVLDPNFGTGVSNPISENEADLTNQVPVISNVGTRNNIGQAFVPNFQIGEHFYPALKPKADLPSDFSSSNKNDNIDIPYFIPRIGNKEILMPTSRNKANIPSDFHGISPDVDDNRGQAFVPKFGTREVSSPMLGIKADLANDLAGISNVNNNLGQSFLPKIGTGEILNPTLGNKAGLVNDLAGSNNVINNLDQAFAPKFENVEILKPILGNKANLANNLAGSNNINNNIGQALIPKLGTGEILNPTLGNKAGLTGVNNVNNNLGQTFLPKIGIGEVLNPTLDNKAGLANDLAGSNNLNNNISQALVPKFETGEILNPTLGNKLTLINNIANGGNTGSNDNVGQTFVPNLKVVEVYNPTLRNSEAPLKDFGIDNPISSNQKVGQNPKMDPKIPSIATFGNEAESLRKFGVNNKNEISNFQTGNIYNPATGIKTIPVVDNFATRDNTGVRNIVGQNDFPISA